MSSQVASTTEHAAAHAVTTVGSEGSCSAAFSYPRVQKHVVPTYTLVVLETVGRPAHGDMGSVQQNSIRLSEEVREKEATTVRRRPYSSMMQNCADVMQGAHSCWI